MRHGANVTCVASDAATKLIQPAYFKWATGNPVITKLTGDLEHIAIADYKKSDLIIVYPSTANTLGKLANGIDDTPIATVLTVGFGSKIPIVMCLAMHASMYENAAVKKNIVFLKKKIDFVSPNMIEGKAKAAEPEDVLEFVLRKFGFSSLLKGKRVLITAGPTIEFLDPIRVITNQSTGKTGVLLADELVSAGAKVTMVYGPGKEKPPNGVRLISVKTANEMLLAVKNEMKKKFDIVIMAAAPSDYTPEKPSSIKIKSTSKKMTVTLNRVPKIIDQVKKIQKDVFLVGFKALARVTKKELEKEARKKMRECGADLMVANDIGSPRYRKNPENNEILIVGSKRTLSSGWKKKEKIVKLIRKEIENRIEKS
jgi:phosphopantothenoylcysteine decarboxylase/phosphopantothenate--cysteine ligase